MRTARLNVPGVLYHVISRFVDRDWYFKDDDERRCYLHFLGRALTESDWRCLAYALMSNHIHLAMVAGHETLSSWAKPTNSVFAQWLNPRHGRLGAIFADRPKDYAVLPDKEGQLIAYIHNNPVRAGVVAHARDSAWTSHRAYLVRSGPTWLDVDDGLRRSGFEDGTRFDAWVSMGPGESGEVEVDVARRAVRRRGRLMLATPTRSERSLIPIMARPFARLRLDPRRLAQLAAEIVGIPEAVVCSGRRIPDGILARRAAVHCGQALGVTGADLAALLGMSPQGVSRIAQRVLSEAEREACLMLHDRMRLELEPGYSEVDSVPARPNKITKLPS